VAMCTWTSRCDLGAGNRLYAVCRGLHPRTSWVMVCCCLTHTTQGDNIFVDQAGLWWLGDFGSAVRVGEAVRTTTPWFAPMKNMFSETAMVSFDW